MKHSLEQLILYLEGELEPAEKESLEQQLKVDSELRAELDELKASLQLVHEHQPEGPGDEYFRSFYSRLQPNLHHSQSLLERIFAPFNKLGNLGFAGSVGLVAASFLVMAIAINVFLIPRKEIPVARTESISIKKNDSFLDHAASGHLERSELLLREVYNLTQTEEVDPLALELASQRSSQLLSENRSFRNAAIAKGDDELVSLLEELEIVLIEMSNLDPDAAEYTLPSVTRAIRKKNLLIKIEIINLSDLEAPTLSSQQEVV